MKPTRLVQFFSCTPYGKTRLLPQVAMLGQLSSSQFACPYKTRLMQLCLRLLGKMNLMQKLLFAFVYFFVFIIVMMSHFSIKTFHT